MALEIITRGLECSLFQKKTNKQYNLSENLIKIDDKGLYIGE